MFFFNRPVFFIVKLTLLEILSKLMLCFRGIVKLMNIDYSTPIKMNHCHKSLRVSYELKVHIAFGSVPILKCVTSVTGLISEYCGLFCQTSCLFDFEGGLWVFQRGCVCREDAPPPHFIFSFPTLFITPQGVSS